MAAADQYAIWAFVLVLSLAAHAVIGVGQFSVVADRTAAASDPVQPITHPFSDETASVGPSDSAVASGGNVTRSSDMRSGTAAVDPVKAERRSPFVPGSGTNANPSTSGPTQPARFLVNLPVGLTLSVLSTLFALAWIIVGLCKLLLLSLSAIRASRVVRRSTRLPVPTLRAILGTTTETMPVVRESDEIDSPVAVGVLNASILLPATLRHEMDHSELRPIILHEMAHVVRRDHWTMAAQRLAEALLFFNPVVWWVGSRMHRLREEACDAWVISRTNEPLEYVSSIRRLIEMRLGDRCLEGSPGLRTGQLDFLARMRRVLNGGLLSGRLTGQQLAVALALLMLVATTVLAVRPFVGFSFLDVRSDSFADEAQVEAVRAVQVRSSIGRVEHTRVVTSVAVSDVSAERVAPDAPALIGQAELSAKSWIRLIGVASGIPADGDKARVLAEAAVKTPDDVTVYAALLDAVGSIRSSGEKTRVLTAVLRRGEIANLPFEAFLDVVGGITSSGGRTRVARELIRVAPLETLRAEWFRDAILRLSRDGGGLIRELKARTDS